MACSASNNFTPTANSKLLSVSNESLRFYLDGFDIFSFLTTAAVIESHGGIVTPADDTTVVLSVPSHRTELKYLRFDVKWLYDTVKTGSCVDIGKYLLDSPVDAATRDGLKQNNEGAQLDDKKPGTNDVTHDYYDTDGRHLLTRTVPTLARNVPEQSKVSASQTDRKKIQNVPSDSETESNFNGWPSAASVTKSPGRRIGTRRHLKRGIKSVRRSRRPHYTVAEQQKIVNYLIEHDLISDSRKTCVWKLMESDAVVRNRRWYGMMKRFKSRIVHNVHLYTDNAKALEEFAAVRQTIQQNSRARK